MKIKEYFIDIDGKMKSAPILIGSTLFLIGLFFDIVTRNFTTILEYFKSMHIIVIYFLGISIILMSVTKLVYIKYNQQEVWIPKRMVYTIEGGTILFSILTFLVYMAEFIALLINNEGIAAIIPSIINNNIFIGTIVLILSVYIVSPEQL